MSNPCLYVFVNTDLDSMNMGKAMAQASHAANAFVQEQYWDHTGSTVLVKAWLDSTGQGFGTQLCMKSNDFHNDYEDLRELCDIVGEVIDPTYPFEVTREVFDLLDRSKIVDWSVRSDKVVCTRRERTAFYVFGDRDDESFKSIMRKYKLHP